MALLTEPLMLGVRHDYVVKLGLPPRYRMDDFDKRALTRGTLSLSGVSHIFCSPDGELYCVRDSDLYVGPLPSSNTEDWFSEATRVGQQEWGNYKILCFDLNGHLHAVDHRGDLIVGPKPFNENRSWYYDQATIMQRLFWDFIELMCFDPEGSIYAITNENKLLKGPHPSNTYFWKEDSKTVGEGEWLRRIHFMDITPDGKLWCIDKYNGNIYKGDPPTSIDSNYLDYAENLGWGYHQFRWCFIQDKSIKKILSLKFLPEHGETSGESLEVIAEKKYDNRKSSMPLKQTFSFEKKTTETSTFSHEHGFTMEVGAETTVKGGIPYIGEAETTLKVNMSTEHSWEFIETNEKEITIGSSSEVEVKPGKAVILTASVMSAQLICPYEADVLTLFGNRTLIYGQWRGKSHYNLTVTQEDYDGL